MRNNQAKIGTVGRILRTVRQFYPVLLPVTVACILFNAVVSSIPSIFMQNVIALVEQNWQNGDWSVVGPQILSLVALLATFTACPWRPPWPSTSSWPSSPRER